MRIVLLPDVNEEMTLAREITDPVTGRILLGIGCGNLMRFSDRLKKADVEYLCVEDSVSVDIEIPTMLREAVRTAAENSLKGIFVKLQMQEHPEYAVIGNCVKELVAEVLRNKDNLINFYELRMTGGNFLRHSVNVAVLSLIIGKNLYYDEDKLRKLGMGALLHDIGMAGLPQTIVSKHYRMSEKERMLFEQHPLIGYHMVKDSWQVSALSKGVILSHHERADGSGYPRCLPKADIHEFSRIGGLADLFDELTGGHPFYRRWSVQETLEYLTIQADVLFDPDIVKMFVSRIPLFPTGATVRLTDGRLAVVCGQNDGFPTRPFIRVFQDTQGRFLEPAVEIDLLHNNHVVLERG